jgi:uncharacterized membrane protein YkvA (DUF1232 family)
MTSNLVIELDAQDMQQLEEIFRVARMELGDVNQGDIIAACRELLRKAEQAGAPGFIVRRLQRLDELVNMVEDKDWALPAEDVKRVINALAYFANAEDLIPDTVPGLGYFDDAVMVDLVVRELRPELDAYESFCEFRENEVASRLETGDERPVTRLDWLEDQRKQVQEARSSRSWLPWKRKSSSFLD